MYRPKERILPLPSSSKTDQKPSTNKDDRVAKTILEDDAIDGSYLEVYQQNQLRRQSELESSWKSTAAGQCKNGQESGSQRFWRIFRQCLERDRWCFCFRITFECTKFALQQRSTIFVLLLFVDFIFNTFMFYCEYVYIMVDVDVQPVYGRYLIGRGSPVSTGQIENGDEIGGGGGSGGLPDRNTGNGFNDQDKGGNRASGANEADSDSKNSISFDQSDQQKDDRSYQYEINLVAYVLIYLSEINGFYAYLWSKNRWLILYLVVVCVELIFLLFVLFINIHLIIVYLVRLTLFFMALHKSLTISDYEMIVGQSKLNEHGLSLPVVRIIRPSNGSINDHHNVGKQTDFIGRTGTSRKRIMSTVHETSSSLPWPTTSSPLTVSNQNGVAVGFITISAELEKRDCLLSPNTTTTESINALRRQHNSHGGTSFSSSQPSSLPVVGSQQTPWMCRVKPMGLKLDNHDENQQMPPTNVTKVLPIKRNERKK